MPINIIPNKVKVKDENDNYVNIDVFADKSTAARISEITTEGGTQVGLVNAAGAAQLDAVLEAGVNSLRALNNRGDELKNVIIAPTRVADEAGLGIVVEAGTETATISQMETVAASATGTWLSAHIDPSTGYAVDDTLSVANAAADSKAVGDALDTKANIDGAYEGMTVGNAEQIVATTGLEDKIPYNFRASGGGADIGNRAVDKIVGGTIAWNQLAKNQEAPSGTRNGVETVERTETYFTLNGTVSSGSNYTAEGWFGIDTDSTKPHFNHKCLIILTLLSGTVENGNVTFKIAESSWAYLGQPKVVSLTDTGRSYFFIDSNTVLTNAKMRIMVYDLTQMFGPAVANYVYGLDQPNAGAGVAWFRKLFPASYYAYNAGELMHVKTSGHKTIGFNQWDEQWEVGTIQDSSGANLSYDSAIRSKNYIPVVGGATYYFKVPAGFNTSGANSKFYYYDKNKTYIGVQGSRGGTTTQMDTSVRYVRFALNGINTYNHDICINLSQDGSRNGEYESYTARTYPLDSDLVLRGAPKLDANNNLYYDGDIYEDSGAVTRRYGIVDLGSLTWNYYADGIFYSQSLASLAKPLAELICTKYVNQTVPLTNPTDKTIYMSLSGSDAILRICDTTYSDKDVFKTALNGVYMVYELANSTTESADPYTNPQVVDNFGTEEYIDTRTIPIPVGHTTFYRANLRDKLQHLPNPADSNGTYVIQQTGGNMSLVTLPAVIPALPSTDGTYKLVVTVNGSTKTLSWEANT